MEEIDKTQLCLKLEFYTEAIKNTRIMKDQISTYSNWLPVEFLEVQRQYYDDQKLKFENLIVEILQSY